MENLYQHTHTHTYTNIQREQCFCINVLPVSDYDRLIDTIHQNDIETDKFEVGNYSLSEAKQFMCQPFKKRLSILSVI